jgi:RNA polymerase sigma factor (sigma-70 family)
MPTADNRLARRKRAGRLRKLRRRKPLFPCDRLTRPLDEAGQQRVEAHAWIAYQLAYRFARRHAPGMPLDDLIAEAFYGLTYAASLFEPERGVPFGAYATMVVRHRLIQSVLAWRRARRCDQLPLVETPDGPVELEAEARPAPEFCAVVAAKEMCERVRRILPARTYKLLRLRYGEGRTLVEIGSRLGLTRQRVRQLVAEAGRELRLAFPEWTRF